MRTVSGLAQLLYQKHYEKLDKDAQGYIQSIINSAERMLDLIRDLLEYSRIGDAATDAREIDCNLIFENVKNSLANSIAETSTELTSVTLPMICINPIHFDRLLQNLISNAIKYRENDRPPKIHLDVDNNGDKWIFSLHDNGIGIKQEYLDQIFVIFKRLHNQEQYNGTGIGLAICKKIIDRIGGKIWVESQYQFGSIFRFTIPM